MMITWLDVSKGIVIMGMAGTLIWLTFFLPPIVKKKKPQLRVWHHPQNDSSHRHYETVYSLVEARLVINALQWYTFKRGLDVLVDGQWVEWRGERGDIYFYLIEELRAAEKERVREESLL